MNAIYRSNKIEWKHGKAVKFQITSWNWIDKFDEFANETRFEIQLFGVTKQGYSVGANVIDFKPYFYIKVDDDWTDSDVRSFVNVINDKVWHKRKDDLIGHTLLKRKDLYGFTNDKLFKYVKLIFKNYEAMKKYSYVFKNEINGKLYKVYEANIEPMLRFGHVNEIRFSGWVSIKKYSILNKEFRTQLEIEASCDNVISIKNDAIAPLLVAAFDIECTSVDGSFPNPKRKDDKIIQIGTTVHRYGDKECCIRHITTLKKCDEIKGTVVESYEDERDVLLSWTRFIQKLDPDIIVGYNIWGFDEYFIYKRAKLLKCDGRFSKLGRMTNIDDIFIRKPLNSGAMGDNFLKYFNIIGRVQIDLMKFVQREHKLDNYKLDTVAEHFMGQKKIDLSPKQLFANFKDGNINKITEIAEYCLKDCELCNYLTIKLDIIPNNIGMSNVCNVPLEYLFMKGQSVKGFSLVAKYCRADGILIPVVRKKSNKPFKNPKNGSSDEDENDEPEEKNEEDEEDDDGYEGALVLTPKSGVYYEPIITVDYNSLYPSAAIAENISHDTIVTVDENGNYEKLDDYNYNTITFDLTKKVVDYGKNGKPKKKKKKIKIGTKVCVFAEKKNGEKGIIPKILAMLLKARKDTRKKMEYKTFVLKNGMKTQGFVLEGSRFEILNVDTGERTIIKMEDVESIENTFDSFQLGVLNGLQLAYKITANSIYGLLGASVSPIYFQDLAASITAAGRGRLMFAKTEIEKRFLYADCIYGDTDSCFINVKKHVEHTYSIKLGNDNEVQFMEYVWKVGELMAKHVNDNNRKGYTIELEKAFYPFVLFTAKRYIGNKYSTPKDMSKFKMDYMGIALKRRDSCKIVKDIYMGVMKIILNDKNTQQAVLYYKKRLEELFSGKVPLDKFVVTKSLKSEYKDPLAISHKVLAQKMTDRDPGNAPASSDRIPYVFVDIKELKCTIKKCNNRLVEKEGKCPLCLDLYCVAHLAKHECYYRCRICFKLDDEEIEKCDCGGAYCDSHKAPKHKCTKKTKKLLQGDLLETPQYVTENKLKLDYLYYFEKQIKKPIEQIFELDKSINLKKIVDEVIRSDLNKKKGNQEITKWFK